MRDFAATSPGISTKSSNNFSRLTSHAAAQRLAVEIAGSLRVELIDALLQQRLQVIALMIVIKIDALGIHEQLQESTLRWSRIGLLIASRNACGVARRSRST